MAACLGFCAAGTWASDVAELEREAARAISLRQWSVAAERCRLCAAAYREIGDAQGEELCILGVGLSESQRHDPQASLQALLAGLAVYGQDPDRHDLSLAHHLLLAEVYLALPMRYDEALVHLEKALSLARSLADRPGEAVALERLGAVAAKRDLLVEAESRLQAALEIARTTGQDDLLALCLNDLAAVFSRQGRFQAAAGLLEELLPLARGRHEPEDKARTLEGLGSVYLALHEYGKARGALLDAEALFAKAGDAEKLWTVRKDLAQVLSSLGETSQALVLYEDLLRHYRELGEDDEWQLPPLLAGAADALAREGRPREQRASLEEALRLWRKLGNPIGEARILSKLGNLELHGNSYEEALKRFEEALALCRSVKHRMGEAEALFDTAHLYLDLGRYEEALLRSTQALAVARELGNLVLEASALRDMARVQIVLGRYDEADRGIEEALMLARRIGSPPQEIDALKLKGELLGRTSGGFEAFHPLAEALALSKKLSDPTETLKVLVSIGLLQLVHHDPAAAARTFEGVLRARRSRGSDFQEETVLKLLAAAYQDLGKTDRSVELYRQAFEAEDLILERTRTDDLLLDLARYQEDVAQDLIPLLVGARRPEEAFAVAERSRARAFLRQIGHRILLRGAADPVLLQEGERLLAALRDLKERLRSETRKPLDQRDQELVESLAREIDRRRQSYETLLIRLKQTNPGYASLVRTEPLSLPAVQALLGAETTLIEYFVLPDQTFVWVIDRHSFQLVRLPVGKQALAERTAFWRECIAARTSEAELAMALERDLLAPLQPYLRHRNLLIIPHGPLHFLPFAALRDGTGASLAERYALACLPSASVLPFLAHRSFRAQHLLVLGDPDGSLPSAAAEARSVASLYRTAALLGREASKTALQQRVHGIDVLHIAAHASFDPARPLFSRLELAGGGLELHETFDLDLSGASLVVLSGCDTGRGAVTDGDDVLSWSRAFLHAGSAAVVATLWPVDDEASSALMTSFHRRLAEGLPPAEALRQAQVEVAGQERWRSPYFWAGFTLSGT